ncbi:MAG: oligosaccharide flippase family protein [Verrucomicrobiales bacterium]
MEKPIGYCSMLKATSTLAGAKVLTILISIFRTKVLAILLGPSGMGALGLVMASTDLARVAFSFGLDTATARRVAETSATGSADAVDHAYRTSARTALFAGLFSSVVLCAASPVLAQRMLGDVGKFWWFGLGALSLVFTPLLGVQLAFLQGLRQTRSLASCQILASLCGAVLNITLVIFLGVLGSILALAPLTITSLIIHHWFLKRHRPVPSGVLVPVLLKDSAGLIKLGSGFAINGIWLAASGWLNLVFIGYYYGSQESVHQIGLYGAASTMSNLYIGILVSAMATEFYPALVQAASDRNAIKHLLNQQTFLAVTLGVPATMGLMIMAPLVLALLYSPDFTPASDLTKWMLAAMAVRFASCPLGFTMLAVGRPRLIVASELAMGAVMISSSYALVQVFGLVGIGIAMLSTNLLYLIGAIFVTYRMGIHWNFRSFMVLAETFLILALCLAASLLFPGWKGLAFGLFLVAGYSFHLIFMIRRDAGVDLSAILRKLLPWKHA